jgi:MFS family permease
MNMKGTLMKSGSTLFLRGVVCLIGLLVLALCVFALPAGIASDKVGYYRPILLGLYVPAIPFFYALYQTLKLLNYIDENKAFSDASISVLKRIKYCALTIAGLFAAGMPYIYYAANRDDAPGVLAIALVIAGASVAIAVFAAVLQKLLQNAMDIKAENDLTV